MATRGNRPSLDHVQALNSIELFFDKPKKEKKILAKWNEYLDHFGQVPKESDVNFTTTMAVWMEKGDELLVELLQTMGQALSYDFDKVKIKRGIYVPRGHGEEQADHYMIRKWTVELLGGKRALLVTPCNEQAKE